MPAFNVKLNMRTVACTKNSYNIIVFSHNVSVLGVKLMFD